MDLTKKGITLTCQTCHRLTRHIPEPDKRDKIVWLCCEVCGDWRLFNNWS